MHRQILNAMRSQAEMAGSARASTRLGEVSSYDPRTHTAKVRIMPEDVETGWLPIATSNVGNGFGIVSAPGIGDTVQVTFTHDHPNGGIISGRLFTERSPAPECPPGELHMISKSGLFIKFTESGIITNGTWKHTGDIEIDGEIKASGNIRSDSDVLAGDISAKSHVHGGTQPGSGTTSIPQ